MRSFDKTSDKSLLFFVEIDRGTENLMNPDRNCHGDISGKIINYMYYWASDAYKQYEQVWNCKFHGFRVLFVANNTKNCARLCRVVSNFGDHNDFVWVTDIEALFNSGIGGYIWYPGGQRSSQPDSIVGKLAFDCSFPKIKYNA